MATDVFANNAETTLTAPVTTTPAAGTVETWTVQSAATATSYQQTVLNDNPTGYWPLNETSGTVAHDVTGNGNNGTYQNTYALGAPSLLPADPETCMNLAGAAPNSYSGVAIGTAPQTTTSVFSQEAWFETPAVNNGGYLGIMMIGNQTQNGYGWGIGNGSGNDVDFTFLWDQQEFGTDLVTLQPSTIYHGVLTFNNGTVTVYINGQQAYQAGGHSTPRSPSLSMSIGSDDGDSRQFNSFIQHVATYSYAMSAGQALAHYTRGTTSPPTPPSPTNLPSLAAGQQYRAAIVPASGDTNPELVLVQGPATPGTSLTVVRGAENSPVKVHAAGDTLRHVITVGGLTAFVKQGG